MSLILAIGCGGRGERDTANDGDGATASTTATTVAPDAGSDGESVVIGGVIQGALPNVPTEVVVVWTTETELGDTLYKFGAGTVEGASFSVTLQAPPPPEATFYGALGVGLVALVPADLDVPDGYLDEEFLEHVLGITGNNAILWRSDPPIPDPGWPWVDSFPTGYACADCAPVVGEEFDDLAVGACDDFILHVPFDELTPFCAWT